MTKRLDSTRTRIRLEPGAAPHGPLDRLYGAHHYRDRPKGSVRVGRDGVIKGSPTGFVGEANEHQKPQFEEDRHGRGYNPDTGHGWPHDAGDSRPSFDRGHHFKNTASGLKASGKDATKSPFSAAHFKGKGER
jgi:hypothetical protein